MWRAPGRKRSSRSRACPGPARCPTRRPPRPAARRPPARPTAPDQRRVAPPGQRLSSPSWGVVRSLTRLRRGAASYRDRPWWGFARSEVTAGVVLHLERCVEYLTATYGHDRLLSSVVPRDLSGWRDHLAGGLGPSTGKHHLASMSGFLAWVVAQGCGALPEGNPA